MARQMTTTGPTFTAPRWAGDYGHRDSLVPGGVKLDAAQFLAPDAVIVTVGVAGAIQGATSVPVAALSGAIPNGTVLDFGTNKFAKLSAAAAAGATALTVVALPTALSSGNTATYGGTGYKVVPSGTAIGRTLAERDASTPYGPAAAADDEIFLIYFEIEDVTHINDGVLYRHGRVVHENLLPGFASLASGVKDAIRANYTCVRASD